MTPPGLSGLSVMNVYGVPLMFTSPATGVGSKPPPAASCQRTALPLVSVNPGDAGAPVKKLMSYRRAMPRLPVQLNVVPDPELSSDVSQSPVESLIFPD